MITETTDIALFPIPDCVTIPGTTRPFHVFEPRYRRMVAHCVDTGMPLGICHTSGVLREARAQQSEEEALQSNQATYKPQAVFSAGRCELIETLPDGRLLIHVHFQRRYQAVTALQNLPFSIFACRTFDDEPMTPADHEQMQELRAKVTQRLLALTASQHIAQAMLLSPEWTQLDAQAFSLRLFGLFELPADLQQHIIESNSGIDRLQTLLRLLNS